MNSEFYKDVLLKVTLQKKALLEGEFSMEVYPELPFKTYGPDIVYYQGTPIDNWKSRFDLEGEEVLLSTSVVDKHDFPGYLPSEVELARSQEYSVMDWESAKADETVIYHLKGVSLATRGSGVSKIEEVEENLPTEDLSGKPEGLF